MLIMRRQDWNTRAVVIPLRNCGQAYDRGGRFQLFLPPFPPFGRTPTIAPLLRSLTRPQHVD